MLSVGRHQQGYPLEGVDVVPQRPKPKNPISELIALLQQANKIEQELKDKVDYWHRKYKQLYADYIALNYDDLSYVSESTRFHIVQSLNSPFFPPHIGAEPGRAKEESRITCMHMLRTNQ